MLLVVLYGLMLGVVCCALFWSLLFVRRCLLLFVGGCWLLLVVHRWYLLIVVWLVCLVVV